MRRKRSVEQLITLLSAVLCGATSAIAPEQAAPFEGTIEATLTSAATHATHFTFTRKGDRLRIENITNKIEPLNILDLATKKVIIVYPHNTTFVVLDLAKKQASVAGVGDPGSAHPDGSTTPVAPGSSIPATTPNQIGPKNSPRSE